VVCGHCLLTLSITIAETLKRLSSLPILMQVSFRWWQCTDRYYNLPLPHLHTPTPFSPSLISLVVSADVKHGVYLYSRQRHKQDAPRKPRRQQGTRTRRVTQTPLQCRAGQQSMASTTPTPTLLRALCLEARLHLGLSPPAT